MRTELSIVAAAGRLPRISAEGGLSGRITAPDTVHLIGTAATPLGGDCITVRVDVGPGARLIIRSVAASVVLPGGARPDSNAHWHIDVGDGGFLDIDTEPTVIAAAAIHTVRTRIALHPTADIRIRERIQIGRAGEDGGSWSGELTVDIADAPLLRHRIELGRGTSADDRLTAPRALVSEFVYPDSRQASTSGIQGVRLPLAAGGSLGTWHGTDLAEAIAAAGSVP